MNVINFTERCAILVISLAAAIGCSSGVNLDFHRKGNCWQLSDRQVERLAGKLSSASAEDAAAIIDKVYSTADSIASAEQDGTLLVLSDVLEKTFYDVSSKYRNDVLYSLMLEREEKCVSLLADDHKRISWKKGILAANAVGHEVLDMPVYDAEGNETFLHRLVDRQTVLLIYGEDCKACTRLMEEACRSSVLKKAASDGKLNLVSIYIGDDQDEFHAKSDVLKDWENFIDMKTLIKYDNAFDGRLVPSLYLISDHKMVKVRGTLSVREIEKALDREALYSMRIPLNEGEKIWGGRIADGKFMPYADSFMTTFSQNSGNQVMPLLLSSDGRYVWSDAPYDFRIEDGVLMVDNALGKIRTGVVGSTLADAYHYAEPLYFPADGKLPPAEFFECPQYNTWIELQYNQNQHDVLEYARGILRNGLPAGIIMIDDTWQEDYGKWVFHPGRFPDPKAMSEELHRMGFKLMLWVCPFVSMDQYQIWAEINSFGGFVRKKSGGVYPVEWWNGYSAELDFSNSKTVEWFDRQLDNLCDNYGVDGFKFDAGDFNLFPSDAATMGNLQAYEYCAAFADYADKYPYNEYRACWRDGGKAIVQRLHDKSHNWQALEALIPEMMATNLMGYWYSCPDMIGGGSFASFLPGCKIEQDLIVRSAQIHALMPMMQFSVAPWRILDKPHLDATLKSVKIREKLLPEIKALMERASKTGEPVVTPLEFRFPHQELADVKDQFMVGASIMVAPMTAPGFEREVVLPEGRWTADDGNVYEGGESVMIPVPLDRIPYFRLMD